MIKSSSLIFNDFRELPRVETQHIFLSEWTYEGDRKRFSWVAVDGYATVIVWLVC